MRARTKFGTCSKTSTAKRRMAQRMRQKMSEPERLLWEEIRGRKVRGAYFTRQRPALGYILDFYCARLCLAIEVDGPHHQKPEQRAYDRERDRVLANAGIKTLRVSDRLVRKNAKAAAMLVWRAVRDRQEDLYVNGK